MSKLADFQRAHRQWVEIALRDELSVRDARWWEAVAVGSLVFVEKVRSELGIKALRRELEQVDGTYALRESGETGTFTGVKPGKPTLELRVVTWDHNVELDATDKVMFVVK